jgi:hypothetical protein
LDQYKSFGWAISEQDICDNTFFEALRKKYETLPPKEADLVAWNETQGDGSRSYFPVYNVEADKQLIPSIIKASKGLIDLENYSLDKVAFLVGGLNIQAPHTDGISKDLPEDVKKIAGVSVVIAIQEDTYMCVFDEDSLTLLSDGSHSIEYTIIFVPKGRAMFFNSFTCLHGGFDYSKFQLTKKLRDLQNNHARMFARFTHKGFKNTLPKNDFFLLEKVSVYIEKECAGT